MSAETVPHWPQIRTAGYDGFVVSFGDRLSEAANRAALAFRSAVESAGFEGIEESSASLVSTYLRFNPIAHTHDAMRTALLELLAERDWFASTLPQGRRLWRVPTVFGGTLAPQLTEAAALAGLTVSEAIKSLSTTRVRVQAIGFAPGMPYLGELPLDWDVPRRNELTPQVPMGALCLAIRQFVLFPGPTPTGWHHVGQTAVRLFQPKASDPFLFRAGDEVLFQAIDADTLDAMRESQTGGAVCEAIQ